ncbi:MAG: hypothetical protein CMO30_22120 [Tistrella sp.]|nr:hypothetical protein [Tistrella sp.]MBA77977.1 hypothetical protein [Tistrella sp.]
MGDAAGDILISIENVNGSAFNDVLEGDAGNNRLVGFSGDDVLRGRQGADFLDGRDGIDIATYSSSSVGVHVDLAMGRGFGGDAEGDQLVSIENVNGSTFDDVLEGDTGANHLIGFSGNDILRGRGGADILDGRDGIDIATYSTSSIGVRVDLASGRGFGGDAEGDQLVAIENVNGSTFDDVLEGDAGANHLIGFAGNDILRGRGGADILDGRHGIDIATYSTSDVGVRVDLALGQGFIGEADADRLISIENVNGSNFDDVLDGDANANHLIGFSGNDILSGRDGDDILDGRYGNDILIGGMGADRLAGGDGADIFRYISVGESTKVIANRDTIKDFSSSEGDRIDLSLIDANVNSPGAQSFTFIGTTAYTGSAGEVRYVLTSEGTIVYADIDGDRLSDLAILLEGNHALTGTDFIL